MKLGASITDDGAGELARMGPPYVNRGTSMPIRGLFAAVVLATMGVPSFAVTDAPAYGSVQRTSAATLELRGDHQGMRAREANREALATTHSRQRARSRYQRDRRAYQRATAAGRHRRAMRRYDRRLVRQQNAYAAAMAAWRRQVRACHRGDHRACRAHAPRASSFY